MSDAFTTVADGGLERVYDGIEAVLPGVMHPVVQMAVWDSIDDFCTRSTIWRVNVQWQLPTGATRLNFNPLDANTRVRWILDVCGMGSRYRIDPPARLTALHADTVDREGTALCVCMPTKLSAPLPSWVIDDWSEAIRDGALYRLFGHPSKPYSNAGLSQFHGRRFRALVQQARVAAIHGSAPAWRFPWYAVQRLGGQLCPEPGTAGSGVVVVPPVIVPPTPQPSLPVVAISAGVISTVANDPLVAISPGVISTVVAPTGPLVSLSAIALAYPATAVGASASRTVTVTNTGATPLTITGATATGDFSVGTSGTP